MGAENDANKPLKGMFVSTTNPAKSLPNGHKYWKGMKERFPCGCGHLPHQDHQLADVILPAAFIYEKGGVYGCSSDAANSQASASNHREKPNPTVDRSSACETNGPGILIPWNGDNISGNV